MFQSPLLLLCDGPIHMARLGDYFVAKIADQSSEVFGQVVHGGVLDPIIIVVIVIVAPPPLVVVGFQLFMSLGRPRSLQVVLKCVHEVACHTPGGKKLTILFVLVKKPLSMSSKIFMADLNLSK